MISFRYHVVSIVAVLLALAIGLLVGASVLNKALVTQLRDQTASAQQRANRATQDASIDAALIEEAAPVLVEGTMDRARVVIVTQDPVDQNAVAGLQRMLTAAGADVQAVLEVRPQMVATDPATRKALSEALGHPDVPPSGLPLAASHAIAAWLSAGTRRSPGTAGTDIVTKLLDGGFLASIGPALSPDQLAEIGGADQVVVTLAGQTGDPTIEPAAFLVPLVKDLGERGVPVGAGEITASDAGYVDAVDAAATTGPVVTVTAVDRTVGQVGMTLGLSTARATGEGGSYGFGRGDGMIPAQPDPSLTPSTTP